MSGEGLGQTSDDCLVPSEVKVGQDPENQVQNGIESHPFLKIGSRRWAHFRYIALF